MHHPHTADAVAVALTDEGAQHLARAVAPQAMQIDFALDAPFALAQPARHLGADAGAAKAQCFVGVEQRAHVETVADGLLQHRLFVEQQLQRNRRRQRV